MQTKITLGEKVKVEGMVVAVKISYDEEGRIRTSYTVEIPKLGNVEYDETEIIREGNT